MVDRDVKVNQLVNAYMEGLDKTIAPELVELFAQHLYVAVLSGYNTGFYDGKKLIEKTMNLQVGNYVELRNGEGPHMVVYSTRGDGIACCTYWSDQYDVFKEAYLPIVALRLVGEND